MVTDFIENKFLSGTIFWWWFRKAMSMSGVESIRFERSVKRFACLMAGLWPFVACGANVGLAGLFPGKALLTIDGGVPRIVAVGTKTREGVTVIATEGDTATIEIDGKRRVLRVGQNVAEQASEGRVPQIVLTADTQGHFFATGYINGASVRFMVDTGATLIAIGASDARRIGLDPGKGTRMLIDTANGRVSASRIKLDSVRVGDVVLNNVDAAVHSSELPVVLLGMSFLNRMQMQRNAGTMTLIKSY
ncbi:MAG: TIGR02281 family clan AA aspartic protease [Candidatus Accumulibacter sp.]|jgi:aspartyl protease family protein|nr:TIGR02281 family clan AA aspartic protease [Accumulibacter sp.]